MTTDFIDTFARTFEAGGMLMYPLAALAFYLYFSGFNILFSMRRWNFICGSTTRFAEAYSDFLRSNSIGENGDIKKNFSLLRLKLLSGMAARLSTLKILSSVAPLLGLLGTVCGMCLSIASTGTSPAGIADGISAALITTQAGLVVAIPAWIITMCASAQTQTLLISLARREAELIRGNGI